MDIRCILFHWLFLTAGKAEFFVECAAFYVTACVGYEQLDLCLLGATHPGYHKDLGKLKAQPSCRCFVFHSFAVLAPVTCNSIFSLEEAKVS